MCSKPDVPKEFLRMYYGPDSNPERRKDFEEWVRSKREKLRKEPAFDSVQEAVKKAVDMDKKEPLNLPSVWKEPRDVGKRYAVIRNERLEDAYIAGYKEVVGAQEIRDINLGRSEKHRFDDIKEL